MSYVVYFGDTNVLIPGRTEWATEAAAKAARTRYAKKNGVDPSTMVIADYRDYVSEDVVAVVTRTNLMSGKKYKEPANTPVHMSPACETYWAM